SARRRAEEGLLSERAEDHAGAAAGGVAEIIDPGPAAYISRMRPDRRSMTARVVPLASDEASEARVAGTADERVALVSELSRRAWALTGRPVSSYTRSSITGVLSAYVYELVCCR